MFKRTNNLGTVTVRGRWANIKTARVYIDEAALELGKLKLQPRQRATMAAGLRSYRTMSQRL